MGEAVAKSSLSHAQGEGIKKRIDKKKIRESERPS